ncbi:6-phosphogluconolactonase [Zeaxanthinibacter enoshimensis]|uniref:6-phosphogluconolactonase n=1 Tax=Zeaxanthinibacter enoshimensis TaxID=392009 RepID=A0A4R6TMY8_9FLAO|nr:6-phosphogluconolactonase [Zeaxanthinibacter enoshimensis]TDQ29451.1 6-phosphogluconolactonase [Zeaxanthinibacter enoshimensis]
MEVKIYESKADVAAAFCDFLQEELSQKKMYHIALSGGSTPQGVFDLLATDKYKDIDWSGVHLYWGDERCVPPIDEQSNYRMTKEHLLSGINIPAENVHRIRGEDIPSQEAWRYSRFLEEKLPQANQLPRFDLLMLGMGDDGHTASVFPHQMELWDAEEPCVVADHPETGQNRVSLSGKIINNAAIVAFLVTGANKAEKVEEILEKKGNYKAYPANRVQPVDGELFWFLDKAAAKGVNED